VRDPTDPENDVHNIVECRKDGVGKGKLKICQPHRAELVNVRLCGAEVFQTRYLGSV